MAVKITTKKTKQALAAKTRARRKGLEQAVALDAIAASACGSVLGEMELERRPIKSLKGLKRRARRTVTEQVERVAKSLRAHKQSAPVLIHSSGEIIDGHIVAEALRSLGETEVWCVVLDHLDEHEREMLHVALNRIGECGDWDLDVLGPLLIDLGEIGFDLEATGFTLPELDIIMTPFDPEKPGADAEEDAVPEPPASPVSMAGDLWLLGEHRLLCGDATKLESYAAVLEGRLADLVFTDCPWNIPIEGFVSGLGKTKHKDFKMGAAEMSPVEFEAFCNEFHELGAANLKPGGVFYSCIDWRSVDIIMDAGKAAELRHINTVVWNKGSGGMGAPYRSAHEFVVVFARGEKLAVNNVELGKHGRDRTNVWSYPGANRKGSSAGKALAHHPTPKPVEMVEDAIKDVSKRGALVLDPFLGSGTTLLAAERSGRDACGIELDPAYVDVAIRRWQALTGKEAVHAESGLTFGELAAERAAANQKAAA